MKKLISYFLPVTKRINSDYNGVIELTWTKGRKVLDSKNANYSYGSLQRILETGLSEINLRSVDSILILGLGGGSVIYSLIDRFNFKGFITAVEVDPVIASVADREFDISESEKLHIEINDAYRFIKKNHKKYDLIIVDIFIDNCVPKKFYSNSF